MRYRLPAMGLLLALTAACMTLTFDERLANGYSLNAAVRDTTADALNAGRLTSEQGERVLAITDEARLLLDTAAEGDERGLALALEVLEALERRTGP